MKIEEQSLPNGLIFSMASVIEADTALWLRNKLGNDDHWSSGALSSLLTSEVLRNTYNCFKNLDPRVRLKLLLAFIEIRRRNLESLKEELNMVIALGLNDEDEWVRMISCILRDYPYTSDFYIDLRSESETLHQMVKELSIQVNETSSHWNLLPCECSYLNKTALNSSYGVKPPPFKNFTLRRKPKSAALRAHLTQRATEAINHKKTSVSHGPLAPNSPLKKSVINVVAKDSFKHPNLPIKSVSTGPIRHHTRPMLRGTALPKKTKLLDITEQPIGGTGREAKKRRKLHEIEASPEETKPKKVAEHQRHQKHAKQIEESQKIDIGVTEDKKTIPKQKEVEEPAPKNKLVEHASQESKPSYAVIPGTGKNPSYAPQPLPADSNPLVSVDPNASLATQEIQRELQVRIRQEQVLRQQQQQMLKDFRTLPQQPRIQNSSSDMPVLPKPHLTSTEVRDLKEHPRPTIEQSVRASQPAKRGLSLTREQMLAAQEMFRSANKVTRAEKALILGFMAGARDNPFPQQGPVLTIKLSEDTENANHVDGNSQNTLIEMLFEMNYETGHWRRLKRTRVLAPMQRDEST